MENCAVYSHYPDFVKIQTVLKQALPGASIQLNDVGENKQIIATLKGGLFSSSRKLTINYRQRKNPSYNLSKVECPLTQSLMGMYNYVSKIETTHQTVKEQLLQKIATMNCEFSFMAEPDLNAPLVAALRALTTALDTIAFAQPCKTFASSTTQHFLNRDLELILDVDGKSNVDHVAVAIDSTHFDGQAPTDAEQLERKKKSEALLTARGIKVNVHLPATEPVDGVVLRTKEELVTRMYALAIMAAKGEGVEQSRLQEFCNKIQFNGFSPHEKELFEKETLTEQERANATWRYESLNAIQWALGLNNSLAYPSAICDVATVVGIVLEHPPATLDTMMVLRSKAEVLQELDTVYRMHWACVESRIGGENVSADLLPGVVYERHYALNWITRYDEQDWDDVSTDT